MNYREFISEFSEESLRKAVIYVAANFFNTRASLLSTDARNTVNKVLSDGPATVSRYVMVNPEGYMAKYLWESQNNPHFPAVFELLNGGQKDSYTNWLVSNLEKFNDATIKVQVEKLSKGSVQFNSDSHLRCAIVLSQVPENDLRQVALDYNIDITNTKRSGLFGSLSGGPNWLLIERVTKHVMDSKPTEYQYYSTFCTTCEKESPEGADHCISCGLLLPLNVCPNCQTRNIKVAKFCMGCGQVR